MRKRGWAVAAGFGSLLLLLTACGGSSGSTSTTGAAPASTTQSTASSASAGSTSASSTSTSASSSSSSASATSTSSGSSPANTAGAQPSSNVGVTFPPVGTTVLVVQHSDLGFVMAKADGSVVYTYAKDSKGGSPTCTGSCASVWAPVTGSPKAGPADTFPYSFSTVSGPGGEKVITYNGYPLYTYIGAPPLSTKGNGIGGVWHVIILSSSDISS
jgi:predicted lipoprotein with Yx(FWY)xxD motif